MPTLLNVTNELLDFNTLHVDQPIPDNTDKIEAGLGLTARQRKRRKERLETAKQRLHKKIKSRKRETRFIPTSPRYDDTFYTGIEYLDTLAGQTIEPAECIIDIPDDVWKSKSRYDPDIS